MNTLVLGGNGFIGSHLVDKLLSKGHNVTVFDKYKEYFREPLKDVKYHYGEFGNRGELSNILSGIDIVYHLISSTHPKTSNDDPIFDITSNVVETLHLLEECQKQKITKIVFMSSGGTVYGIPQRLPILEDSQTNPICSYGIGKLAIEKYLLLYKYLYGLNCTVIRPSNPFGERQKPFGIQGLIPVFLGKILKGETIQIWGDGEVVRDYIYITDLVEAIYTASTTDSEMFRDVNTFNIGSGVGLSINTIVEMLKEVTGREVDIQYGQSRSFDIPEIYLDINAAKNYLSWEPKTPIKVGIARTWEFIKQYPA